jgi:hypothetical protein
MWPSVRITDGPNKLRKQKKKLKKVSSSLASWKYYRYAKLQMAVLSTQISAAMEPTLTLANTPLDLQITICIFLHPFDILALRKVCHQ